MLSIMAQIGPKQPLAGCYLSIATAYEHATSPVNVPPVTKRGLSDWN